MKRHTRLALWSVFLGLFACSEDQVANIPSDISTGTGKSIEVYYGGESTTIDLGTLPTEPVDGVPHVKLSTLLEAAVPGKSAEALHIVDFLAADGFTPKAREHCLALLPLVWPTPSQGYIEPERGNLRWDSSLEYPGCMSVKDVVEMYVEDGGD